MRNISIKEGQNILNGQPTYPEYERGGNKVNTDQLLLYLLELFASSSMQRVCILSILHVTTWNSNQI